MKPEARFRGPVIVALLCLWGLVQAADPPQPDPPAPPVSPTTPAAPAAEPQAQSPELSAALEEAVVAEKFRAVKDYGRAIESFRKSIARHPSVRGYNGLGITYYALGRHEDAIQAYQQALALRPGDAAVHYNSGLAFQDLGRDEDAARAFRESFRLNPANHAASDALGVSLGRLKQ